MDQQEVMNIIQQNQNDEDIMREYEMLGEDQNEPIK